jgi:SAM-dependent methyltransferase
MSGLACRLCGAPLTHSFVDLGAMPLANSYLTEGELDRPQPAYPLHARVCDSCRLVQVEDAVPPDAIFSDYAYFSSYAQSWVAHAKRYAQDMIPRFGLGADSLVVEVASNDGYLLQHFAALGVPVLGIEPAANVAEAAEAIGVPTRVMFLGRETAAALAAEGVAADLIAGNNVLAHVPDLNDFVAGLAILLKPDGVLTMEFPHLMRLVEGVQFDTIYHEHFSYLSLLAVEAAFGRHGLTVFDVAELPTHGGSLRVFARHAGSAAHPERPSVPAMRDTEAKAGLGRGAYYDGFAPRVAAVRDGLLAFLDRAQADGKTVAAYGAAAKGNTLLNFCGVGPGRIEFVVDANPHKQGHWLPGSRLPIHAPAKLKEARPDYVLILPWNLRREIAADHAYIGDWGGRFVVAVPELEIFAPAAGDPALPS